MRRSEMIKKLSCKLICPHVVLTPGMEDCFVPKAEIILDYLEEMGMLPPKRVVSEEQWVTRDEVTFKRGPISHRSWEPE